MTDLANLRPVARAITVAICGTIGVLVALVCVRIVNQIEPVAPACLVAPAADSPSPGLESAAIYCHTTEGAMP